MTRTTHARELKLTEDDVREEHLASVQVPAHWAYLLSVIGGAFLLMVLLMLALGGTSG